MVQRMEQILKHIRTRNGTQNGIKTEIDWNAERNTKWSKNLNIAQTRNKTKNSTKIWNGKVPKWKIN